MSAIPAAFGRVLPEVTAILDGYAAPAILLSRDYQILAANRAYRDLYGDGRPLHDRRCYAVSHASTVPCDEAGESCPMRASEESGEVQRALHVHHTPRGDEHVDVEIRPVRGETGQVECFVEIMRPVRLASTKPHDGELVGRSKPFNRMLELVQRVAPSDTAVLLLGESGTGKEGVAEAIHAASRRAKAPFVPVECSGLTESLFESELFGHEKGAFTGAHYRKAGLVEAARGGTLFLDEIGDIPPPQQVKLLRLLETGAYRRVGSAETQKADFRLICATHRDLRAMVQSGAFREDLYYRISAFPIKLPSLRERRDDLPLLIENLLERIAGTRNLHVSPEALGYLNRYEFRGNIRELRNILERASLLADGDLILREHVVDESQSTEPEDTETQSNSEDILTLEEVEQRYMRRLLADHPHDRDMLARKLGVSKRTLFRKIKALT